MTARDVIAEVLRAEGWTCEYHEPVSGPGECSQCDDSHERLGDKALDDLAAAGYEVVGPLPEPNDKWAEGPEWHQSPGGCVVWTAPGGRVMVQRVEPGNLTPDEARELAETLLAAARAAEAQS